MPTQGLIKESVEEKFKENIGLIRYRLIESMTFLDMADDERTLELYATLDRALVEALRIEAELKKNNE